MYGTTSIKLPVITHRKWEDLNKGFFTRRLFLWSFQTQWNLGSRTHLFTDNSYNGQFFRANKRLGWRTVSRITNTQAGNNSGSLATASSWEHRRGSVSCWLTDLFSVYEHFGSRTFRFTNGLQERIKFVNRGSTVPGIFHGGKGGLERKAENLTAFIFLFSWNLGASNSWKPQGLSRPVMGFLDLYLRINCQLHCISHQILRKR
jgi:hypothetical protein